MQPDPQDALAPQRIAGLSPQLRRAARFVLDNPEEVATRSQRYVARAANLPPPTFSRLARAVGYETYAGLKERCRQDLLDRHVRPPAAAPVTANSPETAIFDRHAAAAQGGIDTLVQNLDRAALEAAARTLARARRVVLIGEMRARAFVDYATYLADMSMEGWRVIGRGAVSLAAETRELGPEDAAVVVTMAPYATRSIKIARLVAESGAPLVAITDSPLSPVALAARHTVVTSTDSPQFFPSYVVATLVLETLVGMVIEEKGAQALTRIMDTARRGRDLNEYWRD